MLCKSLGKGAEDGVVLLSELIAPGPDSTPRLFWGSGEVDSNLFAKPFLKCPAILFGYHIIANVAVGWRGQGKSCGSRAIQATQCILRGQPMHMANPTPVQAW